MMMFDPRVRLSLDVMKRAVVVDRSGPRLLTADRLSTYFRLPGIGTWHRALIDTGAPLTVIPETVWKSHADTIEWVGCPPGDEPPAWLRSVNGLGGGLFRCDLALVQVSFFDDELRCLSPRSIYAKCAHDAGALPVTLIGLGGLAFENRRLEIDYSAGQAWLSEAEAPTSP